MQRQVMSVLSIIFLCFTATLVEGQPNIVCPRAIPPTNVDMDSTFINIQDPNKVDFREISGVGFSPNYRGASGKPLIYVMNDGGGGRRFGIYDSGSGERVLSLLMPRDLGLNIDYEAMSVGTCGIDEEDKTCIYIFDIGDNTARSKDGDGTGIWAFNRTAYPIYKIREPNPNTFSDNEVLPDSYVTTLNFNYFHPSSPTRYSDCEAAFVDSVGWGTEGAIGDIYLLTKWSSRSDKTRLFKIPAKVWRSAKINSNYVYSPRTVGDYSNGLNSNAVSGHRWTRADMSPDGTLIVLGDYYDQYLFLRCPNYSVAQAIAVAGTRPCESWPIAYWDSQFESISFSDTGDFIAEISECTSSYCRGSPRTIPMVKTELDFTYYPSTSWYCEELPTGAPSVMPSSFPTITPMPSVSAAPSPAPTSCQSVLSASEMLFSYQDPSFICSPNGEYALGFRDDTDLVIWKRDDGTVLWSAGTCCISGQVFLHMQNSDANLVIYEKIGQGTPPRVLWASGTENLQLNGAELSMDNDGQARVRLNGVVIWSSLNGPVPYPTPAPTPSPTLPETPAPSPMPVVMADPAPTPPPSRRPCSSFTNKLACKNRGCKWKDGVCKFKKQMDR